MTRKVQMRLARSITALAVVSAACVQDSAQSQLSQSAAGPSSLEISVPLNFRTHLTGGAEVPARETQAQGQAIFKLDKSSEDELSYRLIASNIENVFQAHIHIGPVTGTGPVVVWLFPSTTPGEGPTNAGPHNGVLAVGTITAANLVGPLRGQPLSALIDAIRNGNAYVNVHTSDGVAPANTGPGDFPGGEIRGQL